MLKLLNKYKKVLIAASFAYIYLLALLLAPSKHTAITPGEVNNINDQYVINEIDFNNNFNVVSVYSWHEITVFQKWLIENNPRFDVREQTSYEQTLSIAQVNRQGAISNNSSHNNAIITAYKYASLKDSTIKINYDLTSLTVYATNNSELKIGDEITKINNKVINTNSYEDYLKSFNIYNENSDNVIFNHDISVTIFRNDEEIVLNHSKLETIIFYPNYTITSTSPEYSGLSEKINRGGPSGGMIQALAVYSALLSISYDELKIAGTGTINTNNNNTVGRIGGIVQKYFTVKDNKMDIFIIPSSHFSDIENVIKDSDSIEVILVDDFNDLITNFVNIYGEHND